MMADESKKDPVVEIFNREIWGYLRVIGPAPRANVAEIFKKHPELLTTEFTRNGYKATLLHHAASAGNSQLTLQALEALPENKRKTLVTTRDSKGCTPLQCALDRGLHRSAARMIDYGAPITNIDGGGANIIHVLVRNNSPHVKGPLLDYLKKLPKKELLSLNNTEAQLLTYDRKTWEYTKVIKGKPYDMLQDGTMVPFLVELDGGAGAHVKGDKDKTPMERITGELPSGRNPVLLWSETSYESYAPAIKKLYAFHKLGKLTREQTEQLIVNSTALYESARVANGYETKEYKTMPVELYRDYAARKDVTDKDRAETGTLLGNIAVGHSLPDMTADLLKAGYKPTKECMDMALKIGNAPILDSLLKAGGKADGAAYFALERFNGKQADDLIAVMKQNAVKVDFADPDRDNCYREEKGLTPLMVAARRRNVDTVRLLLKNNAIYPPNTPQKNLVKEAEEVIRANRVMEDRKKPLTADETEILRLIDRWQRGLPLDKSPPPLLAGITDIPDAMSGTLSPDSMQHLPNRRLKVGIA